MPESSSGRPRRVVPNAGDRVWTQVSVDASCSVRSWPHVERYQNTTLRYTPGPDFPPAMEAYLGKPQIIRLFVTLDEVWDYRTDTYDWNYLIGVNKFEGDSEHYHFHYDWPLTVPSPLGVHEEDYLRSHAECAESVMLNIRRYEREVAVEHVISYEKYEEVVERVIEHYKELCPNIRYIELMNEVDIPNFGELTVDEFYPLFQCGYRAIRRLNERHNYAISLLTGTMGLTAGVKNWGFWSDFLKRLAADEDRTIDFYSMHEYHTNPCRILEFYVRHEALVHELGLPDLPLMMTEYGLRVGEGDAGRPHNLQNACGEIQGMILGSYCENLRMFPWCTFHNPNQQLGRTMFVMDEGTGRYVPTPSGHTMKFFAMLGDTELLIEGYTYNRHVATIDSVTGRICVLLSHPGEGEDVHELSVNGLPAKRYACTRYLVDGAHNNWVANHACTELEATACETVEAQDGCWEMSLPLGENAFCLVVLDPIP